MTRLHFTGVPQVQESLADLQQRYGQANPDEADIVVALGGDGFMLQTLHAFTATGKPIYGMNKGTVGFLMRVLSQGQMDLFDLGFARLVGLDAARFRKVFYQQGVRPVALACHGAGIDRSVFATVFNLSRQVHGMPHNLDSTDQNVAAQVFKQLSRPRAVEELRKAAV